jgi:hypothetical protein
MIKFKQGTHKQILYDYLLTGKSITTRAAMIDLGIGDLQGVIRNLKKEGVYINTKDVKVHTRHTKKDGSPKYAYVREYSIETVFDCNVESSTFRTAEEHAEWEQWQGENPFTEEMVKGMEKKYQENHSGNCSFLGKDNGMVSTLQDRLDRGK